MNQKNKTPIKTMDLKDNDFIIEQEILLEGENRRLKKELRKCNAEVKKMVIEIFIQNMQNESEHTLDEIFRIIKEAIKKRRQN